MISLFYNENLLYPLIKVHIKKRMYCIFIYTRRVWKPDTDSTSLTDALLSELNSSHLPHGVLIINKPSDILFKRVIVSWSWIVLILNKVFLRLWHQFFSYILLQICCGMKICAASVTLFYYLCRLLVKHLYLFSNSLKLPTFLFNSS